MATVTPFLWFNAATEEVIAFYRSIFPDARETGNRMISGEAGPWKPGTQVVSEIELCGTKVIVFAGGPHAEFNDAFSFSVACKDQQEIDYYWSALTADGGSEVQCGWLHDRFGVRWQIAPHNIAELLSKPTAMQAMMGMKKLVIAELEAAARA